MPNNLHNPIGLAELIEQVKQELLTSPADSEDIPLLSVDSVELELQVTIQRQDGGQIKVNVMSILSGEVADKVTKDNIHKVKVTLSPLVEKQKLLALYLQRHPEKKERIIETATELLKNPNDPGEGF